MKGARHPVLALLPACLAACGSGFVEPNPPNLALLRVDRPVPLRIEPVAFQVVLDLQVVSGPGDDSCNAASKRLADLTAATSEPAIQNAILLPLVNLAFGCAQAPDRTFENRGRDIGAIRADMQSVALTHGGFTIRPIILYANGSEVPLSRDLLDEFRELRKPLPWGPSPLLWAVASRAVINQLKPEQQLEWTFATDEALFASLVALLERELPLWSAVAQDGPGAPLLDGPTLQAAKSAKLCSAEFMDVVGLPADSTAADIDPASPPLGRVQVPTLLAQPGSVAPPAAARAVLEICEDRCDRFVPDADGELGEAWRAKAGCALTGTTP